MDWCHIIKFPVNKLINISELSTSVATMHNSILCDSLSLCKDAAKACYRRESVPEQIEARWVLFTRESSLAYCCPYVLRGQCGECVSRPTQRSLRIAER